MTKNFLMFLKDNGIDLKNDCTREQSKKKTYNGSTTLIQWVACSKFASIPECLGQDYLCFSANVADALAKKEVKLSDLNFTSGPNDDGEEVAGIIMPRRVTVLAWDDIL